MIQTQYDPSAAELEEIVIEGAKEHNLKNISLTIPRDSLVVISGLSGSGKSSLAFDTIYAEGQRRYVECLSPYARQFLGVMKKPDADRITGLSPAISIEQKSVGRSSRSTVGTVTEIYDYLRLLYAKLGTQYCVNCDIPVESKSAQQMVDELLQLEEGTKITILAPLIRGKKGHYRELFEQYTKLGYTKVRIDGEIQELYIGQKVDRYKIHDIELVIDRVAIQTSQQFRLSQSVDMALQQGEQMMICLIETPSGTKKETLFSTAYSCPSCASSYEPLSPNMFSFNSPYGACKTCDGMGDAKRFTRDSLILQMNKSLRKGAIPLLQMSFASSVKRKVEDYLKAIKLTATTPLNEFTEEQLDALFFGTNETVKSSIKISSKTTVEYSNKFEGIIPLMTDKYNEAYSVERGTMEQMMVSDICPTCNGGRLKKDNLAVKIDNESIYTISSLSIVDAKKRIEELYSFFPKTKEKIFQPILFEISQRLGFLLNVGLDYLHLHRAAYTLSGGESQRIRLASQIGTGLVGVTYILDEPSIGLHQHDNYKLIQTLKDLKNLGNTVIVVEHDRDMIKESDYLIDIGPGAGVHGGEILVSEPTNKVLSAPKNYPNSITTKYLSLEMDIETPKQRRIGNGKSISLVGATGNNLQNVTLEIPLGKFVCITGMSGSGKSSLINDTLYPILARHFHNSQAIPLPYERIENLDAIDKVIEIDQTPIGRTPRSNPATYTGLFTVIRDFFTLLPEAKIRGYKAGRFSFNVEGGRCEDCKGDGIKKIEMSYLPAVYVTCETCNGKRYNDETLQVLFKEKSIADVLEMTVEEAVEFFKDIPRIHKKIAALYDVGLTYIRLGQQAPTLSGGEAQRVKLATELSKVSTGNTLYLLDEPTTGLHFEDINILLKLLNKLVEKGNSVVVVEHNLDVIKSADWIVDMGPLGGANGGKIVTQGTPEHIISVKESLTGVYLAPYVLS
ncbi:MAG: excinuclease ABC subunit UvrA [Candidatus Kapabacteria bacterium]|nr:excinuclease ABC subunit UvrA [Candidatus Kapabacteria bacterium]